MVPRESVNSLKVGEETEASVIGRLSDAFYSRLSLDPPFPYPYRGHYYPVDLRILYRGATAYVEQRDSITSYVAGEHQYLGLYFFRGKLKFYSLHYEARDPQRNRLVLSRESTAEMADWSNRSAELVPYAGCVAYHYETRVLGQSPKRADNAGSHSCPIDAPDFEQRLREDGYFERLKDGYSVQQWRSAREEGGWADQDGKIQRDAQNN